jgi:hypothetical protein
LSHHRLNTAVREVVWQNPGERQTQEERSAFGLNFPHKACGNIKFYNWEANMPKGSSFKLIYSTWQKLCWGIKNEMPKSGILVVRRTRGIGQGTEMQFFNYSSTVSRVTFWSWSKLSSKEKNIRSYNFSHRTAVTQSKNTNCKNITNIKDHKKTNID